MPHASRRLPSGAKIWNRLLSPSATQMAPSGATARMGGVAERVGRIAAGFPQELDRAGGRRGLLGEGAGAPTNRGNEAEQHDEGERQRDDEPTHRKPPVVSERLPTLEAASAHHRTAPRRL